MIYEFRCRACHRLDTMIMNVAEMESGHAPACCGTPMRKILSLARIQREPDYVTRDITGDPVRITSRQQRDKLCAEHGTAPKLVKPWV